jgi:predicted DNA-binding transcriptional regulator AlpA
MTSLSQSLYDDVISALTAAGRLDLVSRMKSDQQAKAVLTSKQAAELLGVASANTVKNWLKGGYFPEAYQTPGGHWRFLRSEVLDVRARMDDLRDKNRRGDITPPDAEGDGDQDLPPLL